jgi:TatD DNase family protein
LSYHKLFKYTGVLNLIMDLIDVHAHLDSNRFKKDLDKVIENFKKAGGKFVINSGVNKETNRLALKLSEKYDLVKVSFGIYPIDALVKELDVESDFLRKIEAFDVDDELKWIEKNESNCVAIGECGLDYKWITDKNEEQKKVFEKVIKMALKIDKPLIIHSRKAEEDAVDLLEKNNAKKVVMHCFNGKKGLIKRCIENGWYFSIPPVIKRLHHFQNLTKLVPLSQILTETDAPYLSPVAGERNEPQNVEVTIEEIAKVKEVSKKNVSEAIFQNAKTLFKL